MRYQTVLFDLDGTILDTNELILQSFMYTLERFFPGQYSREDVIPHMGDTLYNQMARFSQEMAEELVDVYREHNEKIHDEYVQLVPHVMETVQELENMAVKMGVVTTKQRTTAVMGLRHYGLEQYMGTIITFQDVKYHKPHPEPVLKAMEDLDADPAKTVMVGDSSYDIRAAKEAGIDVAAVKWSLKGVDYLKKYQPNYLIDDMRDLLDIVKYGQHHQD